MIQQVGNTKNMEHLLRKTNASNKSQCKKEAMEVATSKNMGRGLPEFFEVHMSPQFGPGTGYGATVFNVCPTGF